MIIAVCSHGSDEEDAPKKKFKKGEFRRYPGSAEFRKGAPRRPGEGYPRRMKGGKPRDKAENAGNVKKAENTATAPQAE